MRHPSLWTFITHIKNEQERVDRQAAEAERGDPRPRRRRRWLQLEQRITHIREQYAQGVRTLTQFWDAIVYAVHQFV